MDVHITGGAGFIGSSLVRRCLDEGHDVTIFDNVSRGDVDNLDDVLDDVRFIEGDVRDYEEFAEAVNEPDIFYHFAAINGTKNFYDRPTGVLDVNVDGVQNATRIAAEQGVDRLVFTSSSEVYGFPREFPTPEDHPLQIMDPENPRFSYAGSKILGEQYVIQMAEGADFEYTIVRPHNIYGEVMGYDHVIPEFIERIVTDSRFTIYGDGTQTRSFCYITDAIEAIYRASVREEGCNETFNVGNPHEIEIGELAELLFEVAGVSPEIEHIESEELEGSTPRRQPDISRARKLLGYEPDVDLLDGLARTFDWYCEDFTGTGADEWRREN